MLLFLSPEGARALGFLILIGLYLFLGWIWPIIKIRDKNVKTKSGWVLMLIIIGILPIVAPIIMMIMDARRNATAVSGTSMNAMGPQPVVNQGAVSQMNAGPR
jgi:uncharacterized membrane protein HdeD (DUF308 family)